MNVVQGEEVKSTSNQLKIENKAAANRIFSKLFN